MYSGVRELLRTSVVVGLADQVGFEVHLVFVPVHALAGLVIAMVEINSIKVFFLMEVRFLPMLRSSDLSSKRLLGFALAHDQAW